MRIAFYAPLKSPDHPVPSGDRQMARLLMRALGLAGHTVEIASGLRSFVRDPADGGHVLVKRQAALEIARLTEAWQRDGAPDLWFCYHPYYKAPDWIGPALAASFSIPYVTAEASYSSRCDIGPWAGAQAAVVDAVGKAALNICFTQRDREGLAQVAPAERLASLPPFIDIALHGASARGAEPPTLMTVAMMRPGDKMDSFVMLARALALIADLPWRLVVIGDGPCRDAVRAVFAAIDPARIDWRGEVEADAVANILAEGDLLVWPGYGEAYGLAYLEAQAAGLPVVAQNTAGVPEVVRDGETGILTPKDDLDAFARAIALLLGDGRLRRAMATEARRFVFEERSLEPAARRLGGFLEGLRR
jgi:glycosyltransferase involved in cell wall biosynthesis